ncbi:uncharacterized protein C8A04DRAFT_29909 [Dichotomopilus funicola]|uniref:Transmembrane protein n=1 Tax=Dichotomopilus funicola TaxID=1934379 RepID=A0AAN6ZKB7_9PEZI|nr:hypothetical protein C8A04DRAFT_29909 [Dichotomopilus funicola]
MAPTHIPTHTTLIISSLQSLQRSDLPILKQQQLIVAFFVVTCLLLLFLVFLGDQRSSSTPPYRPANVRRRPGEQRRHRRKSSGDQLPDSPRSERGVVGERTPLLFSEESTLVGSEEDERVLGKVKRGVSWAATTPHTPSPHTDTDPPSSGQQRIPAA